MASTIHINGLPSSFSNAQLRKIFVPFGTVESAQMLKDVSGHSLGLGVVKMSCPEEVEQIFSAQQLFQVEGKHLDIWEPPDPDRTQL
ncbi:MAG TPA: RNA-binding protein [Nitrospira sp.]|nr:RNA-binding protein [Nitrospira sp.]